MGSRVDNVRICMTVYIEFAGHTQIDFVLPEPIDQADPLVLLALERNRQLIEAEIIAAGPAGDLFT